MGRNLAVPYPAVVQKTEFVSDELSYLAEEISKKITDSIAWCFLAAYSKIQEKRDKLREC